MYKKLKLSELFKELEKGESFYYDAGSISGRIKLVNNHIYTLEGTGWEYDESPPDFWGGEITYKKVETIEQMVENIMKKSNLYVYFVKCNQVCCSNDNCKTFELITFTEDSYSVDAYSPTPHNILKPYFYKIGTFEKLYKIFKENNFTFENEKMDGN